MLLAFAEWLTYKLIGLDPDTLSGRSVNYFIYDSIKIILLLFFMIFAIGFIRTYLPQNKIKKWMSKKGVMGNIFVSLFGAIKTCC